MLAGAWRPWHQPVWSCEPAEVAGLWGQSGTPTVCDPCVVRSCQEDVVPGGGSHGREELQGPTGISGQPDQPAACGWGPSPYVEAAARLSILLSFLLSLGEWLSGHWLLSGPTPISVCSNGSSESFLAPIPQYRCDSCPLPSCCELSGWWGAGISLASWGGSRSGKTRCVLISVAMLVLAADSPQGSPGGLYMSPLRGQGQL